VLLTLGACIFWLCIFVYEYVPSAPRPARALRIRKYQHLDVGTHLHSRELIQTLVELKDVAPSDRLPRGALATAHDELLDVSVESADQEGWVPLQCVKKIDQVRSVPILLELLNGASVWGVVDATLEAKDALLVEMRFARRSDSSLIYTLYGKKRSENIAAVPAEALVDIEVTQETTDWSHSLRVKKVTPLITR
jgi:hypothetical protein